MKSTNKDKNERKLLLKIDRLERELKKLKSQYNTLKVIYEKNEDYLMSFLENINLDKAMDSAKTINPSQKKINCPSCSSKKATQEGCEGGHLISCPRCNYRNMINE